jgi:serine/threonine protein phosphatase 1
MMDVIKRLVHIFRAARPNSPAVVPLLLPDGPIYAIGDIHGQLHQLENLVRTLWNDAAARQEPQLRIAPLGDMIDRGPDSAGVIAWMLAPPPNIEILPLRGNHEAMFLDFLKAPDPRAPWLRTGGAETLASSNACPPNLRQCPLVSTVLGHGDDPPGR